MKTNCSVLSWKWGWLQPPTARSPKSPTRATAMPCCAWRIPAATGTIEPRMPEHGDGEGVHLRLLHDPGELTEDHGIGPWGHRTAGDHLSDRRRRSTRLARASGSVSSHTEAATSIDQANSGARRRFMPGVRSETTVVAMHTEASRIETITMPVPTSVRAIASLLVAAHCVECTPTATGGNGHDGDAGADEEPPDGRQRGPGEGDVGGPDLHRHHEGGEPDEERGGNQQGETEPVEAPPLEEVVVAAEDVDGGGVGVLQPDDHAHDGGADQQETARPATTSGRWPCGRWS